MLPNGSQRVPCTFFIAQWFDLDLDVESSPFLRSRPASLCFGSLICYCSTLLFSFGSYLFRSFVFPLSPPITVFLQPLYQVLYLRSLYAVCPISPSAGYAFLRVDSLFIGPVLAFLSFSRVPHQVNELVLRLAFFFRA